MFGTFPFPNDARLPRLARLDDIPTPKREGFTESQRGKAALQNAPFNSPSGCKTAAEARRGRGLARGTRHGIKAPDRAWGQQA